MTELSPTATAVLTAYNETYESDRHAVAAALRAATDQVVPETTTPWNSTLIPIMSAPEVRDKLLTIATELEAL